ncbi:hypothetical protein C8A01DRAFT_37273 [Parachaetomium inaequale]|uniref:Uncharacterized protein n=1 Tax=Parachaetomium inaequale TaxID=2588326 RepID=A0AAN6PHR8_9PEZI|nr:hypothetical protein C8A01DRAFT_37273 [Parachaetomium inaequale]
MADLSLPSARELGPDPDTIPCHHRHQILAVAAESDGDQPVPVTLYRWNSPVVLSANITAVLPPRLFSNIKGSTSLGTFLLPKDGLDDNIPSTFSGLLMALQEAGDPDLATSGPGPTPQLLADLVAQITAAVPGDRGGGGTLVQFFTFPLFSDNPTEVVGEGLFPVWKWVKPESAYSRTGFWKADLGRVLDHGDWNAGRDLTVLVGGVSEETQRAVAGGRSSSYLRHLRGEAGAGLDL